MGVGDRHKPYLEDLIYEELTGGLERRQVLYEFKRKLNFDPEEVDAMPRHLFRMWLEGINWERRGYEDVGEELDDFAEMGFTVREV